MTMKKVVLSLLIITVQSWSTVLADDSCWNQTGVDANWNPTGVIATLGFSQANQTTLPLSILSSYNASAHPLATFNIPSGEFANGMTALFDPFAQRFIFLSYTDEKADNTSYFMHFVKLNKNSGGTYNLTQEHPSCKLPSPDVTSIISAAVPLSDGTVLVVAQVGNLFSDNSLERWGPSSDGSAWCFRKVLRPDLGAFFPTVLVPANKEYSIVCGAGSNVSWTSNSNGSTFWVCMDASDGTEISRAIMPSPFTEGTWVSASFDFTTGFAYYDATSKAWQEILWRIDLNNPKSIGIEMLYKPESGRSAISQPSILWPRPGRSTMLFFTDGVSMPYARDTDPQNICQMWAAPSYQIRLNAQWLALVD